MLDSTRPCPQRPLRRGAVLAALLTSALLTSAPPATAATTAPATALVSAVETPAPAQVERTPDGATYTVRLRQEDAVGRRWTGTEVITFSNTGDSLSAACT